VYVHICIVCYPCGVTINDDDDDDYTCTLSPLEKCAVVSTRASHPSFDLMTSGSTHAYYSACHGLATDLVFIAQVVYLLEHKRLKIHTQQQLKKNGKETEKAKKHGDFGRKMEKSIYVYTHTHTHTHVLRPFFRDYPCELVPKR